MAKKKGLLLAAAAFASSPQGRRFIQQAKEFVARPENRAKAEQVISQVRAKGGAAGQKTPPQAPPAP